MRAKDIQTSDPNNQLPVMPSIGGVIVPGQPFTRDSSLDTQTYQALWIRVGVGSPSNTGTLVLEDADGIPQVIEVVVSNEWIPAAKARRVLSGPVVTPKGTFTTDCEKMQWFGGSY